MFKRSHAFEPTITRIFLQMEYEIPIVPKPIPKEELKVRIKMKPLPFILPPITFNTLVPRVVSPITLPSFTEIKEMTQEDKFPDLRKVTIEGFVHIFGRPVSNQKREKLLRVHDAFTYLYANKICKFDFKGDGDSRRPASFFGFHGIEVLNNKKWDDVWKKVAKEISFRHNLKHPVGPIYEIFNFCGFECSNSRQKGLHNPLKKKSLWQQTYYFNSLRFERNRGRVNCKRRPGDIDIEASSKPFKKA